MIVLPCTNEDESCEPGTFHRFPEEGETVELTCDSARIIGSNREFDTTPKGDLHRRPMTGVVTHHIIEAAHQVGVRLEGDNYNVVVWVDVDDDIKESA